MGAIDEYRCGSLLHNRNVCHQVYVKPPLNLDFDNYMSAKPRSFGCKLPCQKLNSGFKEEDAIDTAEMSEQEIWLALPSFENEEKAELLVGLSARAGYRGAGGEALEFAKSALSIYEALGATAPATDVADCHLAIATAYRLLLQNDEAIDEIDIAIALHSDSGYPFLDDLFRTRATWCFDMYDWEGSIESHLECIKKHEIEGNELWTAKSWLDLGICNSRLSNYPEAISALDKAQELFKSHKLIYEYAQCERWLAEGYAETGDGQRALKCARNSMTVAEFVQQRVPRMHSLFVLGKAMVVLSHFEDAERYLGQAAEAAVMCNQSEMDWEFILKVQRERVDLLHLQKRFDDAEELQNQILTVEEIIE